MGSGFALVEQEGEKDAQKAEDLKDPHSEGIAAWVIQAGCLFFPCSSLPP
jgi:hypothetical protein